MKKVLRSLVATVGLYLLVVVGGTLTFMCVAPLFGYLGRRLSWPEWGQLVVFVVSWGVLVLPFAAIIGVIAFSVAHGLDRLTSRKGIVRCGSGVVVALLSAYVVVGMGWYINIDGGSVLVSLALGGIFGSWVLPRTTAPSAASNDALELTSGALADGVALAAQRGVRGTRSVVGERTERRRAS